MEHTTQSVPAIQVTAGLQRHALKVSSSRRVPFYDAHLDDEQGLVAPTRPSFSSPSCVTKKKKKKKREINRVIGECATSV